jgi:predicted Zn-dependent peptidase
LLLSLAAAIGYDRLRKSVGIYRSNGKDRTMIHSRYRRRSRKLPVHGSLIAAALICMTGTRASPAAPPDVVPPAPDHPAVFDRVVEHRLDNGMLFLLLPRGDAPMFSGAILVKVGNVDNPPGSTGLAHMFEHMAFKGTDRIGARDFTAEKAVSDSLKRYGKELTAELRRGAAADTARIADLRREIIALEERQGEHLVPMAFPQTYDLYTFMYNAYTNQDFTVYTATLPANNLEVWMLMESERLQHPVFREFYSELEVVKEERRMRTEDNPEGAAYELLKSLAFREHPYRYPTIGYMEDLETLNPTMIEDFWNDYYTPGNIVAALAGDFDLEEAKRLIDAYFGDIPARPLPDGIDVMEPEPAEMSRSIHRQGEERQMLMAFPGFAPDDSLRQVAGLLASVLSRDKTSRLDRRLDLEEGVARSIYASATGGYQRYRGLVEIIVDLMDGATNERVEEMVWEELARLVTKPVTREKLDEIRASYRKKFIFSLERNESLAGMLVTNQASYGDWRYVYRRFDAYDRVTTDDVTALVRDLLRRERATVVSLEPEDTETETKTTEGGRQ